MSKTIEEMRAESPPCANCGSFDNVDWVEQQKEASDKQPAKVPFCKGCRRCKQLPRKGLRANRFHMRIRHPKPDPEMGYKSTEPVHPWVEVSD